VVAVG